MSRSHLSANLQRLRHAAGLTQKDLALAANLPRATLASLEQGEANPRLDTLLAVAAAARLGLHGQQVVRVAVHPGDTGVPQLLASIDQTLASFAARRRAGRYADLLGRSGV